MKHTPLARWGGYVLYAAIAGTTPVLLQAQSDTSTIGDATGAILPGSTVKLTNTDTGAVLTATAKNDGNLSFPAQPRGNYRIEASHDGF